MNIVSNNRMVQESGNGRVAAVVVTYNRKDLLLECIEALLAQESIDLLDILIIDNASTDGTSEALSQYINNSLIQYVNTGENLGGAGGFSFGIELAVSEGYSWIWVMDDDCIPSTSALSVFLKFDEQNSGSYGFLSSKVLWSDGTLCSMNVQRRTLTEEVSKFDKEVIPIAMASFVSLFLPVSVVQCFGLPIKEFFIWTDDWEFTRRISRNMPCYLLVNSTVTHKSKSNIGADIASDDISRLNRYKYLYRNDVYLYRREGLRGFVYEVLRLSYHIGRVLFSAKNNRLKRLGCIIFGTREGLRFNPEIVFPKRK